MIPRWAWVSAPLLVLAAIVVVFLVRSTPRTQPTQPPSPAPTTAPISARDRAPSTPQGPRPAPSAPSEGIQQPFCKGDPDCAPPALCFRGRAPPSSWGMCLAGECRVDADCRASANCLRDGALARCVDHGTQTEGGSCSIAAAATDAERCRAGLVCAGICVRPCEILDDGSDDCPPGGLCKSTPSGNVCTVACDPRRCADGETCLLEGLRSHCGRLVGPDCERRPVLCGPPQACVSQWDEASRTLFSECRAPCPSQACPAGLVCATAAAMPGFCLHSCKANEDCGDRGLCQPINSGGDRGCVRLDR